jgi:hypothetical protein
MGKFAIIKSSCYIHVQYLGEKTMARFESETKQLKELLVGRTIVDVRINEQSERFTSAELVLDDGTRFKIGTEGNPVGHEWADWITFALDGKEVLRVMHP